MSKKSTLATQSMSNDLKSAASSKLAHATDMYHSAKAWQIALFALNNTATNVGMMMMGYYAMFTQNVLGLSAVIVGFIATAMRLFDGITDPIIGFFLDKTNGRFGKFRPFMVIGNIIMVGSMIAIFNCPLTLSTGSKYAYTTIWYVVYIFGYTFQTACTKGAQAALTNNPKQRPMFSVFDGVYNTVLFNISAIIITSIMASRYEKSMIDPQLWKDASLLFGVVSIILTVAAVAGIWKKDRTEFFGLGEKGTKVHFKDYWPIIKENRAIQMLVIAASTDKLAMTTARAASIYLYANLFMNVSLQGEYAGLILIPNLILLSIALTCVRKTGQKKAFVMGTWISMGILAVMWMVGPNPEMPWIFLGLMFVQQIAASVSGNIVIPMIADCADYETYRSGRFVPGMMGTLFSFVDKFVSAFSTAIWGLMLGAIGMASTVITPETFISNEFNMMVMIAMCGIPILGHIASIIAMKFYPLTSEKMAEIQQSIAEIKKAA